MHIACRSEHSCDVMMDACTCVMNMWTAPWPNINDQSPARNCMHSLSRDAMTELNRYNVLYYRHGRLSGYTGHSWLGMYNGHRMHKNIKCCCARAEGKVDTYTRQSKHRRLSEHRRQIVNRRISRQWCCTQLQAHIHDCQWTCMQMREREWEKPTPQVNTSNLQV